MNKKLILFLLVLVSIFSFKTVFADEALNDTDPTDAFTIEDDTTSEPQYRVVVEDDAHLLSDEEIEKLKDKMSSLTKYGHIAFKTINQNSMSASAYAESYYHQTFGTESGSVFLIDMYNRKIWIFSDGRNFQYITYSKASSITDNTYKYAHSGDYYKCAYYTFDQMEAIFEDRKIPEPMRYTSNGVIAVVLAFFINFLVVLSHARIKEAKYTEVAKGCDIDFNLGAVNADKIGTHRVYSPQSSGSSSGGGGGGGGGSSGGGGGHSF